MEKSLLSLRGLFNVNLDEMTESECLSEFRFRKRAILADVLGIPETIRSEQGSTCDGLERY